MLVPHAGWQFSGLCAASVFKCFLDEENKPVRKDVKTVIVLTTFHSGPPGFYVPNVTGVHDPVTNTHIPVDKKIILYLRSRLFVVKPSFFEEEHSFDVQIPWIKLCFPEATVLPMFINSVNKDDDFGFMNSLNGEGVVWIVTSDLVHAGPTYDFLVDYDNAYEINRHFCSLFACNKPNVIRRINRALIKYTPTICGINAIKLFFSLAFSRGLYGKITSYYCSADLGDEAPAGAMEQYYAQAANAFGRRAGNKVIDSVGYGGIVFLADDIATVPLANVLTRFEQRACLACALSAILLDHGVIPDFVTPAMSAKRGVFVTIRKDGDLRGCVGTWSTDKTILRNVPVLAADSAADSRFPRLTARELSGPLEIEITLLGKPVKTTLDDWQMGKDGIILAQSRKKLAIFLPSVPQEFGWDRERTLQQLIYIRRGVVTTKVRVTRCMASRDTSSRGRRNQLRVEHR